MFNGTHVTASGNVGGSSGGTLHSAVLTAAGATSTLTLKQGGSGGTTILVLSAVANTSAASGPLNIVYAGQLHATLSGASATATVVT